jgi:hypothetical protein
VSSNPATNTTNKTASVADSVIHSLVFDLAVKAVEADLLAAFPILNLPIIKQLQNLIVQYIAGKIYSALATMATFAIIDVQVNEEAKDAHTAIANLQLAITNGDQNEINKAKSDFTSSFQKLVHYDGSASN